MPCGYHTSCPIPDLSPQGRGVRAGQGEDGAVQAAAGDGGLPGGAGAARTLPRHAAQVSRYGVYKIEHFFSKDSLAYKLFAASLHSSVP